MLKKFCDKCGEQITINPGSNCDWNYKLHLLRNDRDCSEYPSRNRDLCRSCGEKFMDIIDNFFKKE